MKLGKSQKLKLLMFVESFINFIYQKMAGTQLNFLGNDCIKYYVKYSKIPVLYVVEEIGNGKYGTVHSAKDKENNLYAVKVMNVNNNVNTWEIQIWLQLMKQADYTKYFPKIYLIAQINGLYFVVMEYFECGHIDYCYTKTLNYTEFLKTCKTILKKIAYVHKHRLVYNDLKAHNILINSEKIRLTDVGLMTIFDHGNIQCGTPLHNPPESFIQIRTNDKKDIWSFGLLVYYFLTGKHIQEDVIILKKRDVGGVECKFFKYKTEKIIKKLDDISKDFESLPTDYDSKLLETFIKQCLTVNYYDRPSAEELLKHEIFNMLSPNESEGKIEDSITND